MRSYFLFILLIVIVALAPVPGDVQAAWPTDGLLVCSDYDAQESVKIVSDGAGGMIVAWADRRNPDRKIYGQRLDGSGNPYWADGGIQISGTGDQRMLAMVSDDAGGAIILWLETATRVEAQRVDGSGTVLWGERGILVIGNRPLELVAAADGAGGVVIAYNIESSGYLYAQRINSSGTLMWDVDPPGHVLVSDASTEERSPSIIADGSGGALIAFLSNRMATNGMVYVQRVFSSGNIWLADGVQVAGGVTICNYPVITGDGTGGIIVAWEELGGGFNVGVQRISASGVIQWTSGGLYVGGPGDNRECPGIVSDGAGGAYIGWMDERDYNYDIYAQRVDAWGNFLWTDEGVPVCQETSDQVKPILLPAEAGFIAVWEDRRNPYLIFGQKVDIGGGQVWAQDGVFIIEGEVDSEDYDFDADGAGGVLAAINDDRLMAGPDIYAQSINTFGDPAAPEPVITDLSDVPGDQGGFLRITLDRSDRDDFGQSLEQVANYDIWQRINGLAASLPIKADLSDPENNISNNQYSAPFVHGAERGTRAAAILGSGDDRVLLTAPSAVNPDGAWEFIGSFDATQSDEYTFRATTLVDSTASGNPYSVYVVTAHTTSPSVWFISEPDSGYTVDNLAPGPPLGIACEQSYVPEGLQLTWDQNSENDLWYYAIYRGVSGDFIPGAGNLIATPTDEEYLDGDWSWEIDYWYKISAFDIHGNESIFTLAGPGDITGDDPMPVPETVFLAQNYPNPFNPVTTIGFSLPEAAHVKIVVYNVMGALVATIADREFGAGIREISWEGKDDAGNNLASGIYHYSMTTGDLVRTRKMVMLR